MGVFYCFLKITSISRPPKISLTQLCNSCKNLILEIIRANPLLTSFCYQHTIKNPNITYTPQKLDFERFSRQRKKRFFYSIFYFRANENLSWDNLVKEIVTFCVKVWKDLSMKTSASNVELKRSTSNMRQNFAFVLLVNCGKIKLLWKDFEFHPKNIQKFSQ